MAQAFFPFARIGACLMVAPLFGARFVPARTRIVLAVALTALVVPMLPAPDIAPFSGQGFVVVAQQLLIGVALGFALQVVFDALGLAGQLLANSMGLSFAFNVDPLRGSSTAALGQLYIILATLVFLSLGGHLALIEVLVDGFKPMPIGATLHVRKPLVHRALGRHAVLRCDLDRAARRHRAADRQPGLRRGVTRRALAEPVRGRVSRFH